MSQLPIQFSQRPPLVGLAWLLSVAAHATVLGVLITPVHPRTWPSSIGQRIGAALKVRLVKQTVEIPHPAALAAPPKPSPPPLAKTVSKAFTSTPPENSEPMQQATPESTLPLIRSEPAPATTAPLGASFANLFAPIISRPMGRGRWGSPPPPIAPPPDTEQLRQQAIQARRDQFMQTIQWLQRQLDNEPLAGSCQIQITLSQSGGEVICAAPEDQHRVSAAISPFLVSAMQANVPHEICLQLQERTLTWSPCPPAADRIQRHDHILE